jgi:ornithine cyclodeaminase
LKHALDAGLLTRNDVHGELGAVAAGRKCGRSRDTEISIADLTGVGFQDTAIASAAFALLDTGR